MEDRPHPVIDRTSPLATTGMMFDDDARPVTPQVILVGNRASSAGYTIRDFLSRNGVPYDWVDLEDVERLPAVVSPSEMDPSLLPICILPNGIRLAPATLEDVAAGLGMMSAPSLSEYDLAIVGAGPAGLAAAVYAASEGLRTLAIEAIAPGGQAGTTSMIENYLGFPQGISGSSRHAQRHKLGASERRSFSLGNWSGFRKTAPVTWPACPTQPSCEHRPCWWRAGSTGVDLRFTGSTISWVPGCTTEPARAKL